MIQKVHKTVEVPLIQYIDKIVDVPMIQKFQETVEVPEIQYIDKIVEVPLIQKVQNIVEVPEIQYIDKIVEVPMNQKVQKTVEVEVPEIQYIDKSVEVPLIQKVQKIAEVPQFQYIDKIIDVPMIQKVQKTVGIPQNQYIDKNIEVPMIPKVQMIVEVPQFQYIDKIVDVPIDKNDEVPMIQKVQKTEVVPPPNNFMQVPGFCVPDADELSAEVECEDAVYKDDSCSDEDMPVLIPVVHEHEVCETDVDYDSEDWADEGEAMYEAEEARASLYEAEKARAAWFSNTLQKYRYTADKCSQDFQIQRLSAGAQLLAERMQRQLGQKTPIERLAAARTLQHDDSVISRLADGVDCPTSEVHLVLGYLAAINAL